MISVVIPVFQAERFLETAVQSACNQKEVSEVILIEDSSADRSLEICENIERHHTQVCLLRHPDRKNHGAGASRNLGIRKAKNEFIAFLDADDYFLRNRFKRDIEILRSNPDIDGVYNALGWHLYDDSECERVGRRLTTVTYRIPPDKLFEEMEPVGKAGYFSGDTLTVRRSVFHKVGLFDTGLELTQDTHMWIKMAAKTSLASGIIDQPVAMRGVHTGNRIKDSKKLIHYRPLLFLSLLVWAKRNEISDDRKFLLYNCLYKAYSKSTQRNILGKKVNFLFFLYRQRAVDIYFLKVSRFLRYYCPNR